LKKRLSSLLRSIALLSLGAMAGFYFSGPVNDVRLMFTPPPEQDSAQAAWQAFTGRIDVLATRILEDDFPSETDRDRAEGIRQLVHVIVDGLRWEFDNASAQHTGLVVNNTDTSGWGGPNVDNKYLRGRIDGDSTYILSGNIGNLFDLAIQTNKGDLHQGQIGASATLDLSQLEVEDNGDFTLVVSPEPHEGNWIQQGKDHTILSLRAYYLDWDQDGSGRFYLVKEGMEGQSPPPLTEAVAAQRLANATHWIETNLLGWDKWLSLSLIGAEDNQAMAPRAVDGGSTTLLYGGVPFSLGSDMALVIEIDDPQADYFSFQTYTYSWFDAGDYANRQTSLNSAQVHRHDDGKIRFVLSSKDPGVQNWIDTEGRQSGLLTYRYMRAENPNKPHVTILPFEELKAALPPQTPVISPLQRRASIAKRQRHVQQRFHN
jgi:hypothetical protein